MPTFADPRNYTQLHPKHRTAVLRMEAMLRSVTIAEMEEWMFRGDNIYTIAEVAREYRIARGWFDFGTVHINSTIDRTSGDTVAYEAGYVSEDSVNN